MHRNTKVWLLSLAVAGSSLSCLAQTHTENAKMTRSTTDETCLQLKDDNVWSAYATWMTGVAPVASLDTVIASMTTVAPQLTSTTHPPVVGYGNGVKWESADMSTTAWVPQGLTNGVSPGGTNYAIVSWHYHNDNPPAGQGETYPNGSRIAIVKTDSLASAVYRNVILVQPTGTGTYAPVQIHVGGLAVAGNYLYVADTNKGFRVFDLSNFRDVDGDSTLCRQSDGVTGIFGKVGTNWCADGYGYMLPQVGSYSMPSTKEDGTAISSACKPKFSFAGKDTRQATNFILSGEYCNNSTTDPQYCEGDSTGLNGRLYQWSLASTNKLATDAAGYLSPNKVYFFNERNVQGVAPDMVSGAATDSYWLASTKGNGAIFKVSPSATAKTWFYTDSLAPWHPEGMHATTSSGHLWMVTEGNGGTNPATGGRVLIYIDQTAVN